MHMALGASGCFWLNQDSALALLLPTESSERRPMEAESVAGAS